ncbi:hypothetical protein D3C81_1458650 [compost metagenome]
MVFLDMRPLNKPEVMISTAQNLFDQQGNLTDAATREFIQRLLAALQEWALQHKG